METLSVKIGSNIKAAREKLNLKQEQLAAMAGFASRQTISDIERGNREVKAHELAVLADILCISMKDLLLGGQNIKKEAVVCWRVAPVKERAQVEARLLRKAGQYAMLRNLTGMAADKDLYQVDIEPGISLEEAGTLGEEVHARLGLGDAPASGLIELLEERFDVQVWRLPEEELGYGSAASVKDDFGNAIFLNNKEPLERQIFSCAHELFHLVTWNTYKTVCSAAEGVYGESIEKLANSFAASLLLPKNYFKSELARASSGGKISYLDLVNIARKNRVIPETVLWRMQNLNLINNAKNIIESPEFTQIKNNHYQSEYCHGLKLPERFVRLAFEAYRASQISRGKLAELLDVSMADITEELMEYGINEEADYSKAVCTL